ncbi:MAG TPA: hypothetical protein VK088_02120 [Acidimicrobiia bacterium]|nr:hypothetical protein [Acidimicrobiia bacterium]
MITSLESLADIQYALRREVGVFKPWTVNTSGVTLGTGGSIEAEYAVVGQICFFVVQAEFGTGLSVGDFRFTQPPPEPHPAFTLNNLPLGDAVLFDAGTAGVIGAVRRQGVGTLQVVRLNMSNGRWGALSATEPFTWAAGDQVKARGWYMIDPDWEP